MVKLYTFLWAVPALFVTLIIAQPVFAFDIPSVDLKSLSSYMPGSSTSVRALMPRRFRDNGQVRVIVADRPRGEFMVSVYRKPDRHLPGVYVISMQKSRNAVSGLLNAFSSTAFLQHEQSGLYDYYIFDRNGDGKITLQADEFPCYFDRSAGGAFCAIGEILLTVSGPRADPDETYNHVQKLLFDLPIDSWRHLMQ